MTKPQWSKIPSFPLLPAGAPGWRQVSTKFWPKGVECVLLREMLAIIVACRQYRAEDLAVMRGKGDAWRVIVRRAAA